MSLKVKELSVRFGEKKVLNNVSFEIEKGQIIGLVAPNGTGKTTLFNAIMRFIPVQSGTISVDNEVYTGSSKDVLKLHKKITFFPDQGDLLMNFSGREHIQMYTDVWSPKKKETDRIIELLEMTDYVERNVQTYSLGMKQRLCFAMMVAANTPVMLMDEVMNGLDPENVSLVSSVLLKLKKEGKIIMVSSHLLDNLDEYADKVFFLKEGNIHYITDWHTKKPYYYKTLLTAEKVQKLERQISLPSDTLHLGNSMLCIPIDKMKEEEQLSLFQLLRSMEPEELTVGPMGTAEYYSYMYSLPIHAPNRSDVDAVKPK